MKKIRNIIIILALLILVTIVILISIILNNKKNQDSANEDTEKTTVLKENKESLIEAVTDRDTFFSIKTCVEQYYTVIQNLWYDNSSSVVFSDEKPSVSIQMSSYFAEKLYNILGQQYIKNNNITVQNIGNTFTYTNETKTIVKDIMSYEISEDFKAYFVKGYNWEFKTSSKQEINIIVVVNYNDYCFAVYPFEYIENLQLSEISVGEKLSIEEEYFSVTKNKDNRYQKEKISTDKLLQEYMDLYKFSSQYDIEYAYETLDEQYRNDRFGSLEEYKKYIKNNSQTTGISKYATDVAQDFTQYVCRTLNNKYFIINEKSPMKYSIMLDPYTIDLQAFVNEYDKSSKAMQIAMNIEKVRQAINDKDYKYVYNKLNDTFRENNYSSIESLENYIRTSLFVNNNFTCEDIEEKNGVYVFKIKVTSGQEDTTEEKRINVIMRLLSDKDFEMSFGQ